MKKKEMRTNVDRLIHGNGNSGYQGVNMNLNGILPSVFVCE